MSGESEFRSWVDAVVIQIMMSDGPDGHIDGHEKLTDFALALHNKTHHAWVEKNLDVIGDESGGDWP